MNHADQSTRKKFRCPKAVCDAPMLLTTVEADLASATKNVSSLKALYSQLAFMGCVRLVQMVCRLAGDTM
jgi:hypothetical protein